MLDYTQYLFGNEERIFINANLGCSSNCSYCYLPNLNIDINTNKTNPIPINNLLKNLLNYKSFKKGRNGTILSLGCYSECWDTNNKQNTLKLLNTLISLNNPIQLSTKCEIKIKDIQSILNNLSWEKQLSIYISSSTISSWKEYEEKTTNPRERFLSFKLAKLKNISMYLYIKPIIQNVTIKDISKYIETIQKYKIDVILGESFTTKQHDLIAPIGNNKLYYSKLSDKEQVEYKLLYVTLKKYANIYPKSIIPILLHKENLHGNV